MDPTNIATLVTVVFTLVAVIWWAAVKITRMEGRIAVMESKVETIVSLVLRRAWIKTAEHGYGDIGSPITVKPEVKKWLRFMEPDLKAFYAAHRGKTDKELLMELERIFGKRLVDKVCIPHNMSDDECLIIALSIAKDAPVELPD